MNTKALISKFISQICEKQYAYANSTLATIVENKMKEKINKTFSKIKKPSKKTKVAKKNSKSASMKSK